MLNPWRVSDGYIQTRQRDKCPMSFPSRSIKLSFTLVATMPPRLELNLVALVAALGQRACHFDIDLLEQCDSTNSVLLARAETGAASGSVVVARAQNAGRGRRGRAWISAVGDSLTFSLLWRLPHGVQPAGLSLAAGLAVARALEKVSSVGAGDTPSFMPAQLKWPNDILLDGRKLGGILVELLPGATHGSNVAVIGCGINLRLPAAMPDELRAQSAAVSDVEIMYSTAAILFSICFTTSSWNAVRAHIRCEYMK